MIKTRCWYGVVALTLCASGIASAATIVDVGPPTSAPSTIGVIAAAALSWTTSDTYQNVQISAWLGGGPLGANTSVSAYLVDQIGAGTTVANEIASSSTNVSLPVTNTAADIMLVPLLTVPILQPGTYYLVLHAPTDFVYVGLDGAVTTAPGVTLHTAGFFVGSIPPYVPSTDFVPNAFDVAFNVTGDLAGVPEPSGLLLLASGVLCLAAVRWRKRTTN